MYNSTTINRHADADIRPLLDSKPRPFNTIYMAESQAASEERERVRGGGEDSWSIAIVEHLLARTYMRRYVYIRDDVSRAI